MSESGVADGQPHIDLGETLRIASGLQNEGKLDDAAQRYETILAQAPAHHDALLGLGLLRGRAKRMNEAVDLFRRAVEVEPTSVRGLLWLGAALGDLARHEEGLVCYQKALSINPDNAMAHWGLGAMLRKCGRVEEAMSQFERAITIKPDFAAARCALADSLQELGFLDEAVTHYETAVAVQPDYREAINNFANTLHKLGRFDEALALYERALALNPGSASTYCNFANALGAARAEDSIVQIEKALLLDPSNARAHKLLGFAFEVLGRLEDAAQAFEKALELGPDDAEVHRHLADLRRFTADDPRLPALEALEAKMVTLETDYQISLQFALGKAFNDLSQYERSFHHWREGNALKRAQLVYDERQTLGHFERIRATFTPELMQHSAGGGCFSDVPVFVVGMPRSGTTLVEQILASHSKVYGAGEIDTLQRAVERLRCRNDSTREFPELVPALSPDALRDLGADYIAQTASATGPAASSMARIVNKLPGNFQFAGLIHLALPNARIIHVRRDPIDTCFSSFSLLFAHDQQSFTYDLGELGRYYRAYATMMEHWRGLVPPGAMLDVQYEDLVGDLEKQARAIVDYCGLAWEDACLSFHENRRPVTTLSLLQVRKPIYRTSVGRWRPYARFIQPLIEALHAPDDAGPIEPPSVLARKERHPHGRSDRAGCRS
jgi:tetratricopeptide (TPR) repeat protein